MQEPRRRADEGGGISFSMSELRLHGAVIVFGRDGAPKCVLACFTDLCMSTLRPLLKKTFLHEKCMPEHVEYMVRRKKMNISDYTA